ncbi:MAG: alpha/beta hydrolase [Bacilli bacterium]|jgi:esterase/lipase|nr:alpha/beta hydrolase [Bacilli bacterium]MCH4210971.1 alpha/beta hydrolase [Bacilli bacterium]MCH4228867.1 alpha/beta hydrolase [Bacilli bacterium]MCH4277671.1 alpha/beta hydrolase [Bacilli bacterium]MCI2055395.1 alpha/beta hydrolase [Bacilli bacterium]
MLVNETRVLDFSVLTYGEKSKKAFLFIHGRGGNKEEASFLADIVCHKGYQVISFSLPKSGERKDSKEEMNPWTVVPEILAVYGYLEKKYEEIGVYAISIGAYFAMLALKDKNIKQAIFVSPLVDMVSLIEGMMKMDDISPQRLENEKTIKTKSGGVVSLEYYVYAKTHLPECRYPSIIVYGDGDYLTNRTTIEAFAKKDEATLYVEKGGEHYFHTPEELLYLRKIVDKEIH